MPVPPEHQTRQLILEQAGAGWHQLAWLLATAVLVWLVWRYYGERPPGWRGRLLRCLRAASVVVLLSLAAAPAWLRIEHSIQPGRIAVAIDTSASMARSDLPDGQARITAATALLEGLHTTHDPQRVTLGLWRIGEDLRPVAESRPWTASDATGAASNLGPQLVELVDQARPDLLLLVSDGRRTRGSELAAVGKALAGRGLRIHALVTGGEQLDPELRLIDIVGPRDIPRDERQPYTIRWRYRALESGEAMRVSIHDEAGHLLDESRVPVNDDEETAVKEAEARLAIHLTEPGLHNLEVRLAQDDLVDRQQMQVRVHDRQLRVLLLAQRPRWDLRYLRAALRRDRTVEVHSYLHPGSWLRWGDESYGEEPTLRLDGATAADYDAIVIGDLPPLAFPPAVQTGIAEAVRTHGLGLLWLPGERGHLAAFEEGPLADLLPATVPGRQVITEGYRADSPFLVQRAIFARESGLLPPLDRNWATLPPLRGRCPIGEPQAGAQVLMETDAGEPLIVSRSYGAGRAVLIGIDDTWRWRHNAGDSHLHRLHSQLLRWASAGRLHADQPWRIGASPFQLHPGKDVHLSVAPAGAIDPATALPEAVTLRLRGPDEAEELVRLVRQGDGAIFSGTHPAPAIGSWQASVVDGLEPGSVQDLRLQVQSPDEENRDPRSDRAALVALCRSTGGRVFDRADSLLEALPDPSRNHETRHRDRIWNRPWPLLLLLSLLCLEWACRRWWRLP